MFIDARILFSATFFGLSMFGSLFLATVLAIFLTHAVVRGDAERGLLQPLVVRPVGRPAVLAGRFAAALASGHKPEPYPRATALGCAAPARAVDHGALDGAVHLSPRGAHLGAGPAARRGCR